MGIIIVHSIKGYKNRIKSPVILNVLCFVIIMGNIIKNINRDSALCILSYLLSKLKNRKIMLKSEFKCSYFHVHNLLLPYY